MSPWYAGPELLGAGVTFALNDPATLEMNGPLVQLAAIGPTYEEITSAFRVANVTSLEVLADFRK